MPVGHEGGGVGARLCTCVGGKERWEREEVAGCVGTGGDEGEDFGDEALLDGCVLFSWLVYWMEIDI